MYIVFIITKFGLYFFKFLQICYIYNNNKAYIPEQTFKGLF